MPEAAVAPDKMEFGIDDNGVDIDAQPLRDDKGKFVKTAGQETTRDDADTDDQASDDAAKDGGDLPETDDSQAGKEEPSADEGLALDDEKAPMYDHDGKFIGGKFLNKYDTIDDQIQAHKELAKENGALRYELQTLKAQGGQSSDRPVAYDPQLLSEDQIEQLIDKKLGTIDELSYEERVKYEENPVRYMAQHQRQREAVRTEIMAANEGWHEATRTAYSKYGAALFDKALPMGQTFWERYRDGAMGPSELRVLLGLGVMAREGMLSGKEPVNKRAPVGREPVVAASRPEKPAAKKTDPRAAQKAELAGLSEAAYGA
jgi:hypothetical protein